jgi:nucleoside-diphosphate-sugar epimerase/acyl carrier protein/ubiquinone/menaquinone biosynthesis C-methylase UbiE
LNPRLWQDENANAPLLQAAIDAVQNVISSNGAYMSMRSKRVSVTHAFHSTLVEDLKASLTSISSDLKLNPPTIPVEFATEFEQTKELGSDFIANHLRNPVFFHPAVERLSKKYPDCLWLEAGSNSTVTSMVNRALSSVSASTGVSNWKFQSVNITSDKSMSQLTSATLGIWSEGIDVAFWPHHSSQTHHYAPVILPPYQFEKSRHWMELRAPAKTQLQVPQDNTPHGLWYFDRYLDGKQQFARFCVRTTDVQYQALVSSHKIVRTAPICPATLEVDMAVEALLSLRSEFKSDQLQPKILSVENHVPLCLDPSRVVTIELDAVERKPQNFREWDWRIVSQVPGIDKTATIHVHGKIVLSPPDDVQDELEFSRYERLVGHRQCLDVLDGNSATDNIMQGPKIYKVFGDVVEYGEMYRGLKRLVGKQATSAGRVEKGYSGDTWLDVHLSDCLSQVGGIWVNCMTDQSPGDMFIANGFELWRRKSKWSRSDARSWDVLASHTKRNDHSYVTDIFIFDPHQGKLVEIILGINYAKVSKLSMGRLLSRLAPGATVATDHNPPVQSATRVEARSPPQDSVEKPHSNTSDEGNEVVSKLRAILAEISGLEPGDIKNDAELADLGIDSLVGMELTHDINGAFECHIAPEELMEVFTFHDLLKFIQHTLRLETDSSSSVGDDGPESSVVSSDPTHSSTRQTSEVPTPPLLNGAHDKNAQPPLINGINGINGIKRLHNDHSVEQDILKLSPAIVLEAFAESKALTDQFIQDHKCDHYMETVLPAQTRLCVALTLEAFKQLGCDISTASPGQQMARIKHIAPLQRLADYLYNMLEQETGLIELRDGQIIRTSMQAPTATNAEILQALLHDFPEHHFPHELTHLAGSSLADVLSGKADGIQVIFGNDEGRRLASGLYADSPLNLVSYSQMEDFFRRLASKLPTDGQPLRILELGAGTGGTTKWIAATLASLDIPVEYTFTDLAPSFVTAARKKYGKMYPFMKFRNFDIEREPAPDLLHTQHIVLASNAIHATHSLTTSLSNIQKTLRPDGFLMMVEMTTPIYWVDVIFGLLEGWWLFDDGRKHAIAHESRWESDMKSVGFDHVDWSDGQQPETVIQRVFIALNSPKTNNNKDSTAVPMETIPRQPAVNAYVEKYTEGFTASPSMPRRNTSEASCILVTGATGSLGSHVVAHLSRLSHVKTIICLNRKRTSDPLARQLDALRAKGITNADVSKFEVIETDSSKPMLGLEQNAYNELASKVTDIIHNAWPMSGKRPLKGFELQFRAMRNLLDLASRACSLQDSVVGFQFISSIAVVGHYPILTGNPAVPEERMTSVEAVLPNGYGDAKLVCERMLDETLHRYPTHFRTMAVRLGQVAGSRMSGYWNHMEHFSFLVKSAQSLGAFPQLEGILSWTPVDDVAGTLSNLLFQNDNSPTYPIYHIDNPTRQPWSEMVQVLAEELGVQVIPFDDWVRRVGDHPGPVESENPAAKLIEFFENDFKRMSCGGLLLDTARSCQHSETLRAVGPVAAETARKYVVAWKESGFLQA